MTFHFIDWLVVGTYVAGVLSLGWLVSRRGKGDDPFLAGRSMPWWAVAVSVLATALSAATFVGGPQQAYAGNLTYFSANLGGLLAVIVVAALFLPAFYRHRVTSIYELLGHRYGPVARTSASALFLVGRVFASGARLFIVAIPFALVAFGETTPGHLCLSILLIAVVATAYTLLGGIRAVIWTDVIQAIVLVSSVVLALVLLLDKIPLGASEIVEALREDPASKLTLIDLSLDPSRPFTLWTTLIGFTLFNLAAFGTDQDLTQRMLTCRNARSGALSVIASNLLGWPVVLLFLVIGLLLHVYYQRPDLMGAAAPVPPSDDSRKIFLEFMLVELPVGLRGFLMAGLFSAAMSSMDSALNAMATSTVTDFYRPLRARRKGAPSTKPGTGDEKGVTRIATLAWAIVLSGFACGCVAWQEGSRQTLIVFALGVMVFAYSGLLGVFLTALLTRRGNGRSVVAALATGFLTVLLLQDFLYSRWAPPLGLPTSLAFPWKMLVATTLSLGVCCCGKPEIQRVQSTDGGELQPEHCERVPAAPSGNLS